MSREIDQKSAILLECGNLLLPQQQHKPDAMIYYIIDGDFPVDIEEEEIVITFHEPQPPHAIERQLGSCDSIQ